MESNESKEGLVGGFCNMILNPSIGFFGNNPAAKALQFSNSFTIPNKIFWIPMAWRSIILCCKPMIKTEITWLRLTFFIKLPVTMPFTRHAGSIARPFKHLWNCKFFFLKMKLCARRYPIVNTCSIWCSSCKQTNPGW